MASPSRSRRSSPSWTWERSTRQPLRGAPGRGGGHRSSLVGELIASEIEVRTGKTFGCGRHGRRRRQLLGGRARRRPARGPRRPIPGPWRRKQRIIDAALPPQRRDPALRRLAQQRFGLHVHMGIRGADRADSRHGRLRTLPPHLLAYSGSSPFVEGVFTHLHSARTQIFTRMFPRCGIRMRSEAGTSTSVTSAFSTTRARSRSTRSSGGACGRTRLPDRGDRICDGQPDLAEAQSLAALMYVLAARIARAVDEGEPLPGTHPARRGEPLARDHGLSGELIDLGAGEGAAGSRGDRASDRMEPARGRGAGAARS